MLTHNEGTGDGIFLYSIRDLRRLRDCVAHFLQGNKWQVFARDRDSISIMMYPSLIESDTATTARADGDYGEYNVFELGIVKTELEFILDEWQRQASAVAARNRMRRSMDGDMVDLLVRRRDDLMLNPDDWTPYVGGLVYNPKKEKPYKVVFGVDPYC